MVSVGSGSSVLFCGGQEVIMRDERRGSLVTIMRHFLKKGYGTYSLLLLEVYKLLHVEKEVHETGRVQMD